MLAEFLKLLQETAVKAAGATIVKPEGDTRSAYLVHNGAAEVITLPPPFRRYTAFSIDSLCAVAKELGSEGDPSRLNPIGAVVWHNTEAVVAVLDGDDRREHARLPLHKSEAFRRLEWLAEKKPPLTQHDLVRLFRTEFRDGGAGHVLDSVRRLDFKRTGSGKSVVGHGKESLGREVELAVQGAADIPEDFKLTVPVYTTPGADFHRTVFCVLEIDVAQERFAILPDADSLTQALDVTQAELHQVLAEELGEIPVYYGTP